ncbi:hypothetical protein F4083_03655, partial [Candidatus Poribacteria bacterium]|nr:hypothetical protein [Candidatus Poribacteria bacterium]
MKTKLRPIYIVLSAIIVVLILSLVLSQSQKEQFQSGTILHESPQLNLPDGVKLRIGKGSVNELTYSPDGAILAVVTATSIWLYDTTNYQMQTVLSGGGSGNRNAAFSPDGQMLIAGSPEGIIYLWDTSTFRLKQTLVGHD